MENSTEALPEIRSQRELQAKSPQHKQFFRQMDLHIRAGTFGNAFEGSRILSKMSLAPRLRERSEEKLTSSRWSGKQSLYIGSLYGLTNIKEASKQTGTPSLRKGDETAKMGTTDARGGAQPGPL